MSAAAGPARAWRAEWTAPSGHPVSTTFATEAQADLFALRRVGAVVDVRPLEPAQPAVENETDLREVEAEALHDLVEGARPAQGSDEVTLLEVVAGLRRTVAPPVPSDFMRSLRARLCV